MGTDLPGVRRRPSARFICAVRDVEERKSPVYMSPQLTHPAEGKEERNLYYEAVEFLFQIQEAKFRGQSSFSAL